MKETKSRTIIKTVLLGIMSAGLYFLLWFFEKPLIEFSKQGEWYFIIPIAIAFVFSGIHGIFTGHFWDVLGIKAKSIKK